MAIEVKTDPDFDSWFNELYSPENYSEEEVQLWYSTYQYQGFNRLEVLKQLKILVPDVKELTQIIMVCALRGPKRAAQTKLVSGRTVESYKIPASGLKGTKGVSCQRITAATADLAAVYLKRTNAPKRLNLDCPGWLQFPSAGSILMTDNLRAQHYEFTKRFSIVIGGEFNEQIYQQMINNAYLNPKLKEFLFGKSSVETNGAPVMVSMVPQKLSTSSSLSSSSSVPTPMTSARKT